MFFISLFVVSYYNQKHQYKKKYLFELNSKMFLNYNHSKILVKMRNFLIIFFFLIVMVWLGNRQNLWKVTPKIILKFCQSMIGQVPSKFRKFSRWQILQHPQILLTPQRPVRIYLLAAWKTRHVLNIFTIVQLNVLLVKQTVRL